MTTIVSILGVIVVKKELNSSIQPPDELVNRFSFKFNNEILPKIVPTIGRKQTKEPTKTNSRFIQEEGNTPSLSKIARRTVVF